MYAMSDYKRMRYGNIKKNDQQTKSTKDDSQNDKGQIELVNIGPSKTDLTTSSNREDDDDSDESRSPWFNVDQKFIKAIQLYIQSELRNPRQNDPEYRKKESMMEPNE